MKALVTDVEAGRRADAVVAARFEVSRRRAVELLAAGAVRINGEVAKPSRRLKPADVLEGEAGPSAPVSLVPSAGSVPLVFRDEWLLVVDKPAGLAVHPGSGRAGGTLVNVLLGMGETLAPAGGPVRPGVVHRLDKGTSGLLVLAKTDAAYWKLAAQARRHELTREYLAIVRGVPQPREGTISAALDRDPRDRTRFAVVDRGGRDAVTRFSVERTYGARAALVRVRLETGRTHQIRVHLAAIGHPLLGDPVYGDAAAKAAGCGRQALHAAKLAFVHPRTGRRLALTSPLPPDLKALLARL